MHPEIMGRSRDRPMGPGRVSCALALGLLLAGCAGTFAEVTPLSDGGAPPERPPTLVVGEVGVANPAWEAYRTSLTKGVTEWFAKNGGFQSVRVEATPTPVPDSVVLTGVITEIDEGNATLRILVGMGAGQAKAKGDFEIRRPDGTVLTKFTARRSYLGGVGMGGGGFIDMGELVRRLGESVAETTAKWTRGEKPQ
jgi:hypothetical protein